MPLQQGVRQAAGRDMPHPVLYFFPSLEEFASQRRVRAEDGRVLGVLGNAAAGAERVIARPGWLGAPGDVPPHELFAVGSSQDQWSWGPAARERFESAYAQAQSSAASVCLWPGIGQVVSDIPSCLWFAKRFSGADILLDPLSMLAPSMLPTAEEHIIRMLETLAPLAGVVAAVLANVRPLARGEEKTEIVPLRRGVLESEMILKAFERLWPAGRPLVMLAEDRDLAGAVKERFRLH